jgi:hypothetical protein
MQIKLSQVWWYMPIISAKFKTLSEKKIIEGKMDKVMDHVIGA